MVLMIGHAKLSLDHLGHPGTGPDLTPEAIRLRAEACSTRPKEADELTILSNLQKQNPGPHGRGFRLLLQIRSLLRKRESRTGAP